MVWLCRVCNDVMQNQIFPKIDLVKKMELIKKETAINFEGFNIINNDINNINKDGENTERKNKEEENGQVRRIANSINNANNEEANNTEENTEDRKICWFYENRKCRFGQKCRDAHPEACKPMLEYGKCEDSRCKLIHPKICRNYYNRGECDRYNCWFTHPTKIENRNPNISQRPNRYEGNANNMRQNQHNQNQEFRSNPTSRNPNFLGNWPTPAEAASGNIHQTLARIIGTIEKVDARMEKIEMRQINRWTY